MPGERLDVKQLCQNEVELLRGILHEMFRLSPYAIGVLDRQGRLLEANEVLESWLVGSSGEGKCNGVEGLFQDREVLPRLLSEAASRRSARNGEVTAVDGQRRRFSASVTVSRVDVPQGRGPLFVIIVEDISEKKVFSQQIVRTEKLASLGTMAGGVAHDFNNILMTILGNTQLLSKELAELSPQIRRRLKNIEQAVLDGAHVVRRLQVFTRKDRSFEKEQERTLIRETVHDVLELTRPRWKNALEKQGLRVDIVKDLSPEAIAAVNSADFREVLTNLVFNAIDAMPSGGVLHFRSFQDGGAVFLEVTDTGVGMDEEVRKKIFDPFFTTKGAGNSGLGLSVCASLVQRWGGESSPCAVLPERGRRLRFGCPRPKRTLPPPRFRSRFRNKPQEGGCSWWTTIGKSSDFWETCCVSWAIP